MSEEKDEIDEIFERKWRDENLLDMDENAMESESTERNPIPPQSNANIGLGGLGDLNTPPLSSNPVRDTGLEDEIRRPMSPLLGFFDAESPVEGDAKGALELPQIGVPADVSRIRPLPLPIDVLPPVVAHELNSPSSPLSTEGGLPMEASGSAPLDVRVLPFLANRGEVSSEPESRKRFKAAKVQGKEVKMLHYIVRNWSSAAYQNDDAFEKKAHRACQRCERLGIRCRVRKYGSFPCKECIVHNISNPGTCCAMPVQRIKIKCTPVPGQAVRKSKTCFVDVVPSLDGVDNSTIGKCPELSEDIRHQCTIVERKERKKAHIKGRRTFPLSKCSQYYPKDECLAHENEGCVWVNRWCRLNTDPRKNHRSKKMSAPKASRPSKRKPVPKNAQKMNPKKKKRREEKKRPIRLPAVRPVEDITNEIISAIDAPVVESPQISPSSPHGFEFGDEDSAVPSNRPQVEGPASESITQEELRRLGISPITEGNNRPFAPAIPPLNVESPSDVAAPGMGFVEALPIGRLDSPPNVSPTELELPSVGDEKAVDAMVSSLGLDPEGPLLSSEGDDVLNNAPSILLEALRQYPDMLDERKEETGF